MLGKCEKALKLSIIMGKCGKTSAKVVNASEKQTKMVSGWKMKVVAIRI
jgi:hypothetical protein